MLEIFPKLLKQNRLQVAKQMQRIHGALSMQVTALLISYHVQQRRQLCYQLGS